MKRRWMGMSSNVQYGKAVKRKERVKDKREDDAARRDRNREMIDI
jgi:hypothetical protein